MDPTYRDWSKPQGEALVNSAMRWIGERNGKPWIAWTHFYDPHLFWHDTPFGGDELGRFDAAVRYVDAQLGRIVSYVQSLPDASQTLIVITADHGQGLGTHGEYGHGQNLFQEDIRVPLIVHAPGFPAQRVKTVVENVDIVPTLLNLLGLAKGLDPAVDGKTLIPLMTQGDAAARGDPGMAIVEGLTDQKQPKNRRAVIKGPYKLFVDLDLGTEKLFNVQEDPLEKKDLSSEKPELVKELRTALQTHTALSVFQLSTSP